MSSGIESITVDAWLSNVESSLKLVENSLNEIPEVGLVAPHSLRDGQLVRFRGMVQDMADPVFYLHKYEVINTRTGTRDIRCGKYRDMLNLEDDEEVSDDSSNLEHCERRSIYCVSIPGLNTWAKPTTVIERNHIPNAIGWESSSGTQQKRHADEMEQDNDDPMVNHEANKRLQVEGTTNDQQIDIMLNHPIEDISNYSCLINVYEEFDEKVIKMNSVLDVIGFLSYKSDCDDFNHLPATLVPRLHAVSLKRIMNSNPFYCSSLDRSIVALKAERIRSDFMCVLKRLFLGDNLAAEYILCNLISRIYHRTELLSLGHFSINLSKIPACSGYTEEVYNILKTLLPKSYYVPMSLEKMNSSKFLPEKDYERNRLKSGLLQLSDHTHLFIDETKMEAGQLNSNGVQNLKALNELVTDQKLDFDFKYLKIEIPVDVPVIVFSEGKSLLSTSINVVLHPEPGYCTVEEALISAKEILKEPLLTEIREYLMVLSHLDFNLAEDLIETIQRDYVKLRQQETRVNQSDLHLLLILARLVSLSFGHTTLTKEMWEKAFDMELYRKERLNNREP